MKILSKGFKPYLFLFLFVLGVTTTLFGLFLLTASKNVISFFLLLISTLFGFFLAIYSIYEGKVYYKPRNS